LKRCRVRTFQIVALITVAAAGAATAAVIETPLLPAGSTELPALQAASAATHVDAGAMSYAQHCAICHGEHREGIAPAFPPLVAIRHQMTAQQITQLIRTGRGRMPAFTNLPDQEVQTLVAWLDAPPPASAATPQETASSSAVQAGDAIFHQNCAFCHGRDAMGGESGPDLTQSKLVLGDKGGDQIGNVVREGRPGTKMPAFNFSPQEIDDIAAYLHARVLAASSQQGKRRGVVPADLQTGNAAEGKAYFNGEGGCAKCHSPEGDLAGIASRYQGLQLEERMLYPRNARSTVTVTLPSGEKISGTLGYLDEFTVGLWDVHGQYHSWSTSRVKYAVDAPVEAHVDLFSKYSDDDIHNLMAYLQTLR